MKISEKYDCVVGSFRLISTALIDNFLLSPNSPKSKILLDTGVSYNVDHIIGRSPLLDRIDICSKFGVDHLPKFDWYLENHLRFLRKDHLEYGLIHFYEEGWEDLVDQLLKVKEQGLITHVGVSNFNIDQLNEYYEKFNEWPEVNEIEYSMIYHDNKLIKFCIDHDIEVLGYGVVGGIHNSKNAKRSFTIEGMIHYAGSNEVVPILRSDYFDHFMQMYLAWIETREFRLRTTHNYEEFLDSKLEDFSYDLSEGNNQPRALNKFRYDIPTTSMIYSRGSNAIQSLDPRTGNVLKTVALATTKVEDEVINHYQILQKRKFMMITDYLVEEKFNMSEDDEIYVTDDLIINFTQNQAYSYLMVNKDKRLIKSGSCEATIYRLPFTIQ